MQFMVCGSGISRHQVNVCLGLAFPFSLAKAACAPAQPVNTGHKLNPPYFSKLISD